MKGGQEAAGPARSSSRWRDRLNALAHRLERGGEGSTRRRVLLLVYLLRIAAQVVRQWARDRCPQQAASLAFQTVLSMVPVLAVCLAAFRATGHFDAESALVAFVSDNLVPVSRDAIAAHLREWTRNITFDRLGLVGLVSTVILAFIMFNSLEKVANQIWRVEHRRTLAQKFAVFYASATIGPFLIGVSLYQAARVGLTQGLAGYLASFLTSFVALVLMNRFLPAARVRWLPAISGALLTTILFEGAKHAFAFYVSEFAFSSYSGVYGALAAVPLLLVWIYWSWLMLLLGVEVAHALQNIHFLERADRRGPLSLEKELLQRVNGAVAARLMVLAVEAYLSGRKVISRRAIADRLDLSDEVVERLASRLKEADLLMEVEGDHVGFTPARPPHEITLDQVLGAFRGDDVDLGSSGSSPLEEVLRDLEADATARTRQLTLDKLVLR